MATVQQFKRKRVYNKSKLQFIILLQLLHFVTSDLLDFSVLSDVWQQPIRYINLNTPNLILIKYQFGKDVIDGNKCLLFLYSWRLNDILQPNYIPRYQFSPFKFSKLIFLSKFVQNSIQNMSDSRAFTYPLNIIMIPHR